MKNNAFIFAALLPAVFCASSAFGGWQGRVEAWGGTPHRIEARLNGRLILEKDLGNKRRNATVKAEEHLVSGTNVLTIAIIEKAPPEMSALDGGANSNRGMAGFSFLIGQDRQDMRFASSAKEGMSASRTFNELPAEYRFVVTKDWPIRRHPWQTPAPEFAESDRAELIALMRGVARNYGSLSADGAMETIWNLKRLEYEQQALLDGVSSEEKKKQIFAAWGRMARFITPHASPDYSDFEFMPQSGINLVSARPPGGRFGSGASAANFNAKSAERPNGYQKYLALPLRFSKLNGKWQIVYGSPANNEAEFLESEKKNGGALEAPDPPKPDQTVGWRHFIGTDGVARPGRLPLEKDDAPRTRWTNDDLPDTFPGAPGYGAPGKILPYKVDANLEPHLKRYNLSAHWFARDPLPEGSQGAYFTRDGRVTNSIPFLIFTPKTRGSQKMPVVWFIPGNGELGTDLAFQFRQKTIFEVVTSEEFQKKRPCYLFVAMPPANSGMLRGVNPTRLSLASDLMNDALFAVIATRKTPPIDKERIYLTGLSYGATGVYDFAMKIPDRFAAAVPVASYGSERNFHPERATDYWHFHNEKKSALSPRHDDLMWFLQNGVEERGGEFKLSTFPDSGHNAWDKAWREEAVWEWMFSKRAASWDKQWAMPPRDPNATEPIIEGMAAAAKAKAQNPKASAPAALNSDHGADRMLDGLLATWYATTNAVSRDEWIQIEYPQPARGAFTITSGTPDSGAGRIQRGNVEASADGVNWTRQASFKNDGVCAFKQADPIRFLRIAHSSSAPQTIAIREVKCEDF